MKFYFDTLDEERPNLFHLSTGIGGDWWLVPNGSIIKKQLISAGATISSLDDVSEPGCYIIDVNGDPNWWSGNAVGVNVPDKHILYLVTDNIIQLVKEKKLRLIIAADREGGAMKTEHYDGFKTTTDAIKSLGLPSKSVLVIQGNKKIEQQYDKWLKDTGEEQVFDVMYSNHFGRIFFDHRLPDSAVALLSVANEDAVAYNSLNRVYRTHRGTHLYTLLVKDILEKGLVSGNEINFNDESAPNFLHITRDEYRNTMEKHFPKFIDGNWSQENAANQYNINIYKDSLISFVTETKFDEDVVFLTEKVFKPIAIGHPMILLASAGTLRGLEDLGFRTDWCGIDPSYNNIEDDHERFNKTHEVLEWWINLPRDEQNLMIIRSTDVINHNFNLIRDKDFHKDALQEAMRRSEDYFRNA